ncbi:aldo/keto reductase [Lacticaseibacillus hulanensis]|uniref:aldo/keto reductase n=1 Tax=Lacticaseibacillus hulanensis TaxID=2493111 RepID=UPI000FDA7D82|nr:aldo/keto reductase [Lacticaseibacillus hulanensis]
MTKLEETYTLSNGVKIPQIGFGTWQVPASIAERAVADALKAGYRHIDTAKAYHNEHEVGLAIKKSGIDRKDIFVTTKLPGATKSYDGALKDFDSSIKELGLDYVDLYLVHAPWPWTEIGANYDKENREVWRAMEEIYASGKAKAIGISNFGVHEMQNVFATAKVKPMVDQIRYFIGNTEPDVTKFAKESGLLVEAYSPLATGRLLGNKKIAAVAAKYQVTTAQLAIRFCLQNGVLPLPKASHLEHAQNNADVDGFVISDDDMKLLNDWQD